MNNDKDKDKHTERLNFLLSRRKFITAGSAAVMAASFPVDAFAGSRSVDGRLPSLDATAPGGIDLYIDRQEILIDQQKGTAITINGTVPGPIIRMTEGKRAVIRVHNRMDVSTSIHWHGILLPYTMDGVPGISFDGIAAGETFVYEYSVRQNGTYWYHSHTGLQEQEGHYGQIIVEPAKTDPVDFDVEHSIVLSDWTFDDPHDVLRNLKTMEGYYNFQRPTLANLGEPDGMTVGESVTKRWRWNWMRMDPTDIADITGATYTYLMNGRAAPQNPTFLANPGEKVRLRIVNASTMTFFDFRIPGLPMTVVQSDGQNVEPVEVDELRVAVAETYDVVVTMPDDGPRTLFAETMDRSGFARGTLATSLGQSAPLPKRRRRPMLTMADMGMTMKMDGQQASNQEKVMPRHRPAKHNERSDTGAPTTHASTSQGLPISNLPMNRKHGPNMHGPASITMAKKAYRQFDDPGPGLGEDGWRVLTYGQLRALRPFHERRAPTREIDLHLTGNMHKYIWGFDGKKWSESDMIQFVYGERLRINFINDTMMSHPIHLHGMWMDLYVGDDYARNPRKHTVDVQPAELLTVDIDVDAPGQWAFHCHLLYHMEAGMFRTVAVVRSLEEEVVDASH